MSAPAYLQSDKKLLTLSDKIMLALERGTPLTVRELADRLCRPSSRVSDCLGRLARQGLCAHDGAEREKRWRAL